MPSKRTLFCLKPTRDVRVTGMTCSYPPEVWRPVTIVVVTYKHRGNNPIKDVINPHDVGIGMPPRPRMLKIRNQVVRGTARESLDAGILHDRSVEVHYDRPDTRAKHQPLSSTRVGRQHTRRYTPIKDHLVFLGENVCT